MNILHWIYVHVTLCSLCVAVYVCMYVYISARGCSRCVTLITSSNETNTFALCSSCLYLVDLCAMQSGPYRMADDYLSWWSGKLGQLAFGAPSGETLFQHTHTHRAQGVSPVDCLRFNSRCLSPSLSFFACLLSLVSSDDVSLSSAFSSWTHFLFYSDFFRQVAVS